MAVLDHKQSPPETEKRSAAISVKNVLFATDFSPTSESALPYATAISRHFGSTLHVAHVLSDSSVLLMTGGVDYVSVGTLYEDAHSDAQERIQRITTRLEGIPHRTYVRHGQVWTNLSSIVKENAIDLIVVGSHGRTGLEKLLLGSVAEDIMRHLPCPVLTVGPKVAGRAKLQEFQTKGRELAPVELELRQIVFATNFTTGAMIVAPVAVGLAEQFRAQLTLMHVIEQYANWDTRPGPIEDGVQKLQALVPKDASLAYPPEIMMEFGTASECILDTAAERDADLIVLGARPAEGATHLPWSTVHRVVAHAACPVLTVPA
ncbi:MAG: universal stress protein [Candidatus Sulfotelmatobacter sp.]|jgi:nucleotide-binding universal stress UspA family protein